jgi:hypothetical protein
VKFRSRQQQNDDWLQIIKDRDEMRKDDSTLPRLERQNPPPISDPPSRELLNLHAALCKIKKARGGANVYNGIMRQDDIDSSLPEIPADDDLALRLLALFYEENFVFDLPPRRFEPFEQ